MSAASDFPPPEPEPTRALLLAQALDTCIQAERKVPGSADQIIARQPAWMRAELRRLLALAGSLDAAAAGAVISEEFRAAARARLMRHVAASKKSPPSDPAAAGQHAETNLGAALAAADSSTSSTDDSSSRVSADAWSEQPATPNNVATGPWPTPLPSVGDASATGPWPSALASTADGPGTARVRKRRSRWLWRGAIGAILAAVLAAVATLSASASSLPGQPLYGLKQATEELGVRFARDDQARTLVLLRQANARLDETAQLLEQGRTDQVADTTQRFDDVLAQATTIYVVTIAAAPDEAEYPTTTQLDTTLGQQQTHLQTMLASAPEPARAELRAALTATERSRALVADPKPNDIASTAGPSLADHALVQDTGVVAVPTDMPPRITASSPPRVDPVSYPSDATPVVPRAVGVENHHEVDTQRAFEAHADGRDDTPVVVSVRTPVEAARVRGEAQPVEHLRIPSLAPAPAVARVNTGTADRGPNPDQPDAGHPTRTDGLHASDALPSVAVAQITDNGPPHVVDDHAVTPSPNQPDAHERVALQPTPPVTAHAPASNDTTGHTNTNTNSNSGPPQVAAQPATVHATHDGAASAQSAPVTPTPVTAVAVANAHSGPSSSPSPRDTHRDDGGTTARTSGGSAATTTQARGSGVNTGGSGNTASSHPATSSGSGDRPGAGGSNSSGSGSGPRTGGSNSGSGGGTASGGRH